MGKGAADLWEQKVRVPVVVVVVVVVVQLLKCSF